MLDHKVRKWQEMNRAYPYPSIEEPHADEVYDCFCKKLEYTPYGMKGLMGMGTNRMNYVNAAKAMQGLVHYHAKKLKRPLTSVVVAFDTSHYARSLAMVASSVLSANGISVHFFKEACPTPLMNHAVVVQGCELGIGFAGRHHMLNYGGFKVHYPDIKVMSVEEAREMSVYMGMVDPVEGIARESFEGAVKRGAITYLDQTIFDSYVKTVVNALGNAHEGQKSLSIVYTPYHGTGHQLVEDLFQICGFSKLYPVDSETRPVSALEQNEMQDLCAEAVFDKSRVVAEEIQADLLLTTDMLGTRFAAMVRHEGVYRLLESHEAEALLVDHFGDCSGSVEAEQLSLRTLLSCQLPEQGAFHRAASDGVLNLSERNGIVGGLLMAVLAEHCKARDMTLLDALERLHKRHGHYLTATRTIDRQGEEGFRHIEHLMGFFRFGDPSVLGEKVQKIDYRFGMEDHPAVNVVKLCWNEADWVAIRPSFFEPKLEFHFSAWGPSRAEAEQRMRGLLDKVAAVLPAPEETQHLQWSLLK